jgi:hypothetical protein
MQKEAIVVYFKVLSQDSSQRRKYKKPCYLILNGISEYEGLDRTVTLV